MNPYEILSQLVDTHKGLESQLDILGQLVGLDGPLCAAIWAMETAYIRSVDRELDADGLVEWWIMENDMGNKRHRVQIAGEWHNIPDVGTLVDMIEAQRLSR
jgi:hypothetical protein